MSILDITLAFLTQLSVLVTCTFLLGVLKPRLPLPNARVSGFTQGVLFGLFAVLLMLNPIRLGDGVIFDLRNVIIAVAGGYSGGVPATIVTLFVIVYRLALGGAGAPVGVGTALTSAVLGIGFYFYRQRHALRIHLWLIVLGLVDMLLTVVWFPLLPAQTAGQALAALTIPMLITYPTSSWLFGYLLFYQEHQSEVETALNTERNMLRTLIDNVPDYIFVKDSARRYLLSNLAHARAAGAAEPSDLIGKTASAFFPPDVACQHDTDDAVVLSGESLIDHERETVNADGAIIWVSTTKIPLRDAHGAVTGIVGISRDLTARKQQETALEEERKLLRTLIDTIPANVYIKDTQSRFVDANAETVFKLGGKTVNDLIGKTDFDFFTPDLAEKYFADEQVIVRSGQPMLSIEEPTFDHRTGQGIWFLTNKAPVLNGHGEVTGIVGVGLDITERKQAAEAQRESERLRLALEKEQELGELKTQLMLTISHEFRTPLSVAYASSELLEQYYERMSALQREDHLHKVQTQVKKLTGMLEEISLLIHAKFGRLALSLEPINLKHVCETVLSQIQDFDGADQRVVFHADEPLPSLMLDVRRFQYVLTNLLSNALKYSDPATKVALDLFLRNEGVIIQVTDHGIGVPPEEQAHIFEPFYRAHNVGVIGGTGLGLSIVKEIVELHRGTIDIKSEVNKGTQISVFLPKA